LRSPIREAAAFKLIPIVFEAAFVLFRHLDKQVLRADVELNIGASELPAEELDGDLSHNLLQADFLFLEGMAAAGVFENAVETSKLTVILYF
jgi:hypothetical protein